MARPLAVVFLATALVLLPLAAGASASDPTWIAGIYDEADGDDVIALIGDTVACTSEEAWEALSRVCLPDEVIHPWRGVSEGACSRERQRGPPRVRARLTSSRPRLAPHGLDTIVRAARPPPSRTVSIHGH